MQYIEGTTLTYTSDTIKFLLGTINVYIYYAALF